MRPLLVAVLTVTLVGIPAVSQELDKDFERFATAMETAQAAAIRPGDEGLACEAMQKEFMAIMYSPALQAHTAKLAAASAQQQKVMSAAKPAVNQQAAPATPQTPAALMSTLVPTGGWGAAMAPSSGAGATGMPTAENLEKAKEQIKQQLNVLVPIMPQVMRAQRLIELTLVRKCQWVNVPMPERPAARQPAR